MRLSWAGRMAALAASLLLAPCGTARRGAPLVGEHSPPTPEIALGQRVFDGQCAQCHPGGAEGLGPALNNKPLPRWLIKFQVRNGLGDMPAFGGDEISGSELDALTRYLVWLRRLEVRDGG